MNLHLSSEDKGSNDVEEMDTTAMVTIDDKGKRQMKITKSNVVDKKSKKPRLVKEPFLYVMEYTTPNMIVDEGKIVDTKKSLVEHYNYLNVQGMRKK